MNPTNADTASFETRVAALLFPLAVVLALAACGGSDDAAPTSSATVGPSGATVSGPAGAAVVIPAGALAVPTPISIAQGAAGAPQLPAGVSAAGPIFALTPHGSAFAMPVTVTIPFDPASLPVGATPTLYKTGAGQTAWEVVPGASVSGAAMTAEVTSFSFVAVVQSLPPVTRNDPRYDWTFEQVLGNAVPAVLVSRDTQIGGLLSVVEDFGPLPNADSELTTFTQTFPPDGIASGQVFGFNNGVTYGVFAEAPSGFLGTAEPIGSRTTLIQRQSFVKNAANATLSFTLSAVQIEGFDYEAKAGRADSFILGEVYFEVYASRGVNDTLFYGKAYAAISGEADTWVPIASEDLGSKQHLWDEGDFEFATQATSYDTGSVSCPGTFVQLKLKGPRTYQIDLSSVGVGEEFTVRSDAVANTLNRKGGRPPGPDCTGTRMRVFLRDPQSMGGTTLQYTGLTPTNNPLLTDPPPEVSVGPAACMPGPGPRADAGTLQFSAAFYAVSEAAGAAPTVMVTRTGGSVGAVTATFATSDGTAVAGTDYQPVLTTVYFGDGDMSPRVVPVPVIGNALDDADRNIVLTLSQPGGCAALGALTSAVLTILDDDLPPTAPPAGLLDAGFGGDGKVTLPRFGDVGSAMALQGDGKIVMVGGGSLGFLLARFNADGSLDTTFGSNGSNGMVTTGFVGTYLNVARAVAMQSDGKIVVAGEARPASGGSDPAFALARFNSDGSLDPSFGSSGLVFDSADIGIAHAVAIQPDGRIVVAGDGNFNIVGPDHSDFQLARYLADGTPDPSFGGGGRVTISIAGSDGARNVVVQPDGAIVASGHLYADSSAAWSTGVARVTPSGVLDPSFGIGGKVRIDNPAVGYGLARQSDGKLLLAGRSDQGFMGQFALMRLGTDGSVDTTFGSAGLVTTTISAFGDLAHAVAVQADARILVAGEGANSGGLNRNFQLVRYLPDGTLDTAFATGGKLVIDFSGYADIAESIAVQPDGKIVLGGLGREGPDSGYGLARVNP